MYQLTNLQNQLYALLFLTTFLSYSCTDSTSKSNIFNQVFLTDSSDYYITNWELLGPYRTEFINSDSIIEENPLTSYGINDDSLTLKNIQSLANHSTYSDSLFTSPDSLLRTYYNRFGMIDIGMIDDTKSSGMIYAHCELYADKDQDIVFLIGSDEGANLYINGEKHVIEVQNPYRLVFQNYVFAKLKKGTNHLVLKSPNTKKGWLRADQKEPWRFIINLCTPTRFNHYYLKIEKLLIKSPVVPLLHPIEFVNQIHPVDSVQGYEIWNQDEHIIQSGSLSKTISTDRLETGLYELRIKTQRDTLTQNFYYGDIHQALENICRDSKQKYAKSPKAWTALSPLIHRYDTLAGYYKKKDFLHISESQNNLDFNRTDSVTMKSGRTVYLDTPTAVQLRTPRITKTLLGEFEFYQNTANGYKRVPYLQTEEKLSRIPDHLEATSISTSWEPEEKNNLFFYFNEDSKPDLLIVNPDFEIKDYAKKIKLPYEYKFRSREIQKRYVYLLDELQNITADLETGTDVQKNKEGTHLRSFISPIEKQPQYYLIQAPRSVAQDTTSKKPLVVVLPWVFDLHMPFLRSNIIADIHIHEMYEWLINQEDVIMLHTNARTYARVVTEPISMNDVLSNIEAVKKDYNIDSTRIHLMSYCGGSELGLSLMEKYPSHFASMGIVGGFVRDASNQWMQSTYAINFSENLKSTPLKIIHGELDGHTSVESIKNFVETARKNGAQLIDFKIEEGLTFEAYPRLRHQQELFSFFKKNQLNNSKEITYSTQSPKWNQAFWLKIYQEKYDLKATVSASRKGNSITINTQNTSRTQLVTDIFKPDAQKDLNITINDSSYTLSPPFEKLIQLERTSKRQPNDLTKNKHTEGPIMNAFSESFILVKNSQKSPDQKTLNDLIDSFANQWNQYYYAYPKIRYDNELSDEDIANNHLILFGNPKSSTVLSEIIDQLPLSMSDNQLSLGDRTFKGKNLGISFLYPNPLNKSKYVVIYGAADHKNIQLTKELPAVRGYYDFEIYSNNDGYRAVMDQGYFNEHWKIEP